MLKRSGKSRQPCLVPEFTGKVFSSSLVSMMLVVGVLKISFLMLRYVSSIPTLMRVYHEWMLNFVKCLFCIYWNYYVTFILLLLVTVVYCIDWFTNVKPSLHPWSKSDLVMVYECSYVLLDSVCWYLVEDSCFYIRWRYWPVICSFIVAVVLSLCSFCIKVMRALQNKFGNVLSSYGHSLKQIAFSFLYV